MVQPCHPLFSESAACECWRESVSDTDGDDPTSTLGVDGFVNGSSVDGDSVESGTKAALSVGTIESSPMSESLLPSALMLCFPYKTPHLLIGVSRASKSPKRSATHTQGEIEGKRVICCQDLWSW